MPSTSAAGPLLPRRDCRTSPGAQAGTCRSTTGRSRRRARGSAPPPYAAAASSFGGRPHVVRVGALPRSLDRLDDHPEALGRVEVRIRAVTVQPEAGAVLERLNAARA